MAVVPLWRAAAADQRQQPLLGCRGLAGAAWLVPWPPCGAAGAARVRGLSSARRAGDSLASGGRPWRPFTSLPLASGGGSSTSGAGAKHMQLAACVGGVIGRSARPLLGLTPVSGP